MAKRTQKESQKSGNNIPIENPEKECCKDSGCINAIRKLSALDFLRIHKALWPAVTIQPGTIAYNQVLRMYTMLSAIFPEMFSDLICWDDPQGGPSLFPNSAEYRKRLKIEAILSGDLTALSSRSESQKQESNSPSENNVASTNTPEEPVASEIQIPVENVEAIPVPEFVPNPVAVQPG